MRGCRLLLICAMLCAATIARAALTITATNATRQTATSARAHGALVATNTANPSVILYYGTSDAGTNVAAWTASLAFGVRPIGALVTNLVGLSADTTNYYRFRATDGAATSWSTVVTFRTLPDYGAPALAALSVSNATGLITAPVTPAQFRAANDIAQASSLTGSVASLSGQISVAAQAGSNHAAQVSSATAQSGSNYTDSARAWATNNPVLSRAGLLHPTTGIARFSSLGHIVDDQGYAVMSAKDCDITKGRCMVDANGLPIFAPLYGWFGSDRAWFDGAGNVQLFIRTNGLEVAAPAAGPNYLATISQITAAQAGALASTGGVVSGSVNLQGSLTRIGEGMSVSALQIDDNAFLTDGDGDPWYSGSLERVYTHAVSNAVREILGALKYPIVPAASNTYDLASALYPWRTGYFHTVVASSNTLVLGNTALKAAPGGGDVTIQGGGQTGLVAYVSEVNQALADAIGYTDTATGAVRLTSLAVSTNAANLKGHAQSRVITNGVRQITGTGLQWSGGTVVLNPASTSTVRTATLAISTNGANMKGHLTYAASTNAGRQILYNGLSSRVTAKTASDGESAYLERSASGNTTRLVARPGTAPGASICIKSDDTGEFIAVPTAAGNYAAGTVSFWVKPLSFVGAYDGLWGMAPSDYNDNNIFIAFDTTPRIYTRQYYNSSYPANVYHGTTPVVGTWYHVALTWQNGAQKLYFTQAGSTFNNTPASSANAWGAKTPATLRWGGAEGVGNGRAHFDEFAIYNSVLTAGQIGGLFSNKWTTTPPSGCGALYHAEQGSGSSVTDSSGNGRTGAMTAMEADDWVTSSSPITVPASPSTVTLVESYDGTESGEYGIAVFGHEAGRTVVDGKTVRMVINGSEKWRVTTNGHFKGAADANRIQLGTDADAAIYYDGTDLVIDPDVVGSGKVNVGGRLQATRLTGLATGLTWAANQTLPAGVLTGNAPKAALTNAFSQTSPTTFGGPLLAQRLSGLGTNMTWAANQTFPATQLSGNIPAYNLENALSTGTPLYTNIIVGVNYQTNTIITRAFGLIRVIQSWTVSGP